jgi:hypothetical protein
LKKSPPPSPHGNSKMHLIFLFEFPPINPSAIGRLVVSYFYPEKHSDANFLF